MRRFLQPPNGFKRAVWTHFYVAYHKEIIDGCGAIGPLGKGKGKQSARYFRLTGISKTGNWKKLSRRLSRTQTLSTKRNEIPAIIIATPFYRRMGHGYKNGTSEPGQEGLLRLEKYRYIVSLLGVWQNNLFIRL